jgi:glycerophosphoryl diester phosphodiesterase
MRAGFNLQGHRGARGLKPENTLPSFEVALDCGVSSVETDLHLTRDGVPVLLHDPRLDDGRAVAAVTLTELRKLRFDRNPNPSAFPDQEASVTPLAKRYAQERGMDPYSVPTLTDLFEFVTAYAGELGRQVGKSDEQRIRAKDAAFDLELKRVPYYPEAIGDEYTGTGPARLESAVVEAIRRAGVAPRTIVRSFDHRCVRFARQMEPALTGAVLISETAPVDPGELARKADATVYSPSWEFLDADQVHSAHAAGLRVLPWTANAPEQWQRLLEWGVDGITTDYPDRLAAFLCRSGVAF